MVELQQGLGQFAVVQAVVQEQGFHNVHLAALLEQAVDVGAIEVLCGSVEVVEEGEAMDVGKEDVRELGFFGGLDESEEVFEHTRCGTRGGDELGELVKLLVGLKVGRHLPDLFLIEAQDAVIKGCGAHQLDILRAFFQLCNLLYYLIFGDVSFRKLLEVFFCKHNCRF